MDRTELMQLFNNPARLGTLSTSDGAGNLNAAVFSALQMVDENTVLLAIGENRSLANLGKHPKAVFCFFEPAASPYEWKGARVYLDVAGIERKGETLERMVAMVRQMAGDQAADNVQAAVTFSITAARPIIDMAG
jgi:hypothetical protein